MKRILDPSFRYVPSHETDVRKTFERIRKEREAGQHQPADSVLADFRPPDKKRRPEGRLSIATG